jgi:methylmalonyl-CoA mutase, C-terminal domain
MGEMKMETNQNRPIRVLVAKPGLDGHDRGAKVIARGLKDAGMEVIYLGLRLTPEQIAEAAIQEDVDFIGLSSLSGAHMALFPRVVELVRAKGGEHIQVIVGGIIPQKDIPELKKAGVAGVFGPGASISDIVKFIQSSLQAQAV